MNLNLSVPVVNLNLSVAVMAHPRRRRLVDRLVERLGVGRDRVVWDRRDDMWANGVRSWQAHDETADWHLVIQDDAVVCEDLLPGLERALERVPASATASLYLGNQPRGQRAAKAAGKYDDTSFVRLSRLVWGVAMIAPVYTISDMIDWTRRHDCPGYDTRVAMYYRSALGFPCWFTWPSLVDHHDGPSLIDHSDGRRAVNFVGADVSALKLDWGGTVATASGRVPASLVGHPLPYGAEFVANRSFTARVNGVRCRVRGGVSRVAADHPILLGYRAAFTRID